MDSQRISTTLSGATKALHHSVTSKMGRKASKMVTRPTPWCLIWFYSSLRIFQNLWKGQKQISSSAQMQPTLLALLCIHILQKDKICIATWNTSNIHIPCIPCFASYYTFCRQLSLFLRHKRNLLITSTFAPHSPTLVAEMSPLPWWLVN